MSTSTGRGLVGKLTEELGASIVSGRRAPGEIVDVQALGAQHEVSRTVVRESVKVLVGKGLLGAKPRHGTYVRGRESWNHLDPDILGWRARIGPDPQLLIDLQEIRAIVEPAAAALAAQRRTSEQLTSLTTASETLAIAAAAVDVDDIVEADLHFHRLLARASGNELLGWMLDRLSPVHRLRGQLVHAHPVDTPFVRQHQAVMDAIRDQDALKAQFAMQVLVEAATQDTSRITRNVETDQPESADHA